MKKLKWMLLLSALAAALLCGAASASDYDSAAQELSSIGIFRGTASGSFDLDRAPTRSEAAIMLTNCGIKTHEQITRELGGGDWQENVEQLKAENELLAAAGSPTHQALPPDDDGGDDGEDGGDGDAKNEL